MQGPKLQKCSEYFNLALAFKMTSRFYILQHIKSVNRVPPSARVAFLSLMNSVTRLGDFFQFGIFVSCLCLRIWSQFLSQFWSKLDDWLKSAFGSSWATLQKFLLETSGHTASGQLQSRCISSGVPLKKHFHIMASAAANVKGVEISLANVEQPMRRTFSPRYTGKRVTIGKIL